MNIFNVSETGFYPKTLNPVQNFLYSCVGVGETPIGIFPSLSIFFGCFVDLRSSTVLGLRQWARWNKEMWLWLLWMRMSWLEACKFMQIRRNNSSLVPSFNQQCRLGVEKRNNIKKSPTTRPSWARHGKNEKLFFSSFSYSRSFTIEQSTVAVPRQLKLHWK